MYINLKATIGFEPILLGYEPNILPNYIKSLYIFFSLHNIMEPTILTNNITPKTPNKQKC